MAEDTGYGLERFSRIRRAVHKAKQLGIKDVGFRRELVIDAPTINRKLSKSKLTPRQIRRFPSVGRLDMKEDSRVIDGAIHKYFEVHNLKYSNSRVLIESVHSQKPNDSEIESVVKDVKTDVVAKLESKFEVGVGDLALEVSKKINAPCLITKKSRIWADLNRAWFKRTLTGQLDLAKETEKVKTAEYSRSGRAALYWAVKRSLSSGGHLDKNERLNKPVLNLSLHGMKDNPDYGFAIAGGVNSASEEVLLWFQEALTQELQRLGVHDSVKIDKKGDYMGLPSLTHFRTEPIQKDKHHPAFGPNFNKIQLEIGAKYRKADNLPKVAEALAAVLTRFPERFK